MPRSKRLHIRNKYLRDSALDPDIYPPIKEAQSFARELILGSFGCPIGHRQCGELSEINEQYSEKNVFVAIPYSDYRHEDAIREVLMKGALTPIVAKDKIRTHVLLCKVCKEIRKCGGYGIADISKNTANVAYELGLMQSLSKKCAILLSSRSPRPTDLQGLENVTYGVARTLKVNLAKWIVDNVKECDIHALEEYRHTFARKGGIRRGKGERIDYIEGILGHLFFPAGTPEKHKTLDYHKRHYHHRIIVNHKMHPSEAYYMTPDSDGWRFIEKYPKKWVSEIVTDKEYKIDDPDFTQKWCDDKGFRLERKVAEIKDLLKSD